MAHVPQEIMQVLKNYLKNLSTEISIDKVILFGSYARGTTHKDSDINLAIISNDFKGKRRVDNINYLLLKAIDYDVDLEPFPFTPDEFIFQEGFIKEVLRDGVEISIDN